MKTSTLQARLNELFDADPRNDSSVAAELGVSKQTISAWRKGERSPKKPMILHIAELYHVSLEWLMGFDVEKSFTSSRGPIFVPDSSKFSKIMEYMSVDDYKMVIDAFNRTYEKMKENGIEI